MRRYDFIYIYFRLDRWLHNCAKLQFMTRTYVRVLRVWYGYQRKQALFGLLHD